MIGIGDSCVIDTNTSPVCVPVCTANWDYIDVRAPCGVVEIDAVGRRKSSGKRLVVTSTQNRTKSRRIGKQSTSAAYHTHAMSAKLRNNCHKF